MDALSEDAEGLNVAELVDIVLVDGSGIEDCILDKPTSEIIGVMVGKKPRLLGLDRIVRVGFVEAFIVLCGSSAEDDEIGEIAEAVDDNGLGLLYMDETARVEYSEGAMACGN